MKKHLTNLLLIFTVLLLSSCSSESPTSSNSDNNNPNVSTQNIGSTGGDITSVDQQLTLTIPAGALGSSEPITIEEITTDDLGPEFDQIIEELGVQKIYELGPDGLQFDNPITVRFKSQQSYIDSDSIGVYANFLFTSSNGSVEALENVVSKPDLNTGTIVVEGELSHFSPLVTSQANNGVSFFVFDVPESLPVGEEFKADARIFESAAGPLGNIVSITGQAKYEDKSSAPISPTFSPTTADIPGDSDNGYMDQFPYTCTSEGLGIYSSELSARVRFDLDSGPVFATSYAPFITSIDCEEAISNTYNLTVEKEGSGRVESDGGAIVCGGTCSKDFPENSTVTLNAEPDEGWVFQSWSGDIPDSCDETSASCTLNMDQNRNVKAIFVEIQKFGLNLELDGEGSVSSEPAGIGCGEDCSEEYEEGTEVTLTANPADGWLFDGWGGDIPEECDDNENTCTVTMDQDRNIVAYFTVDVLTIFFEGVLVCVEHGNGQSEIIWLLDLLEFGGVDLFVVMEIENPDGTKEEVEISSYAELQALFEYTIYTYGDYDWRIIYVEVDGEEVEFDGETEGRVEVDSDEQNPGQCEL